MMTTETSKKVGKAAVDPAKAAKVKAHQKADKAADDAPRKDRFGTRLGTNYAKANAALGKKPKTMRQIMAEAGLADTVYNHLNRLVEAGLVVKSDEGFSLKK